MNEVRVSESESIGLDLQSGFRELIKQFAEMREFLEVELAVHRDLLERAGSGFQPEHSAPVSPGAFACRTRKSQENPGSPGLTSSKSKVLVVDRSSTATLGSIAEDKDERSEEFFPGVSPRILNQKLKFKEHGSRHSLVGQSMEPYRARTQKQAAKLRVSKHQVKINMEQRSTDCRSLVATIVGSPVFTLAITMLILINVILLGIEVDVSANMDLTEVPGWFSTVNGIIVGFFVLEMVLKFIALGFREFWCGPEAAWNAFDFAIVLASVVDLIMEFLAYFGSSTIDTGNLRLVRSIRLARAVRGIRVVRLFRYIPALRTLAVSIISTMGSLFWTLMLLVLVFYFFAVVITQLVTDHCRDLAILDSSRTCPELLKKYWTSVGESMLTLFMAITNGVTWDDAIRPLRDVSFVAVALVIMYVTFAVFAILNVVTGVFCNNAIESASADKEIATIKQVRVKDQQVESLQQIFQEIDNFNQTQVTFEVSPVAQAARLCEKRSVQCMAASEAFSILRQNSPQHPPYGLYPELISGSAFTVPRAKNRYTWAYRIRPSVQHAPYAASGYEPWAHATWVSPPFHHPCPPVQMRFRPAPLPSQGTDFVDGAVTMAANGSPAAQDGCSANTYAMTSSMSSKKRFLRVADGDLLILPQEGTLQVRTECGDLQVEPWELVLVPRGLTFQVNLAEGTSMARGYFLENFGDHFVIPELGPIGISGGLAHPRHFVAPKAQYEELDGEFELVSKYMGGLFRSSIRHSPLDVVAWYGSHVPCKYDMRLFMAINTVTYDHPDPSIGCVMSSYTSSPGLANVDFVIFPPRWLPAEGTFRPPWFHRNCMSEFMGLITGSYDAKPDSFLPGASSIHNRYVPHGPDAAAVEKGTDLDTSKPERYSGTLAFMWETRLVLHPSEYALATLHDEDYPAAWRGVQKRFDAGASPPPSEPYGFPPSR
ncbi:2-dioxygenase (HGDO) (Homogentisate oxygenase) (Homogentisic acid oxidase) (Homogentisicase) [Durusdinium trenchii]|uniref:homogentisate 1,2-dioxygenase n=1 Tax=Durusdinium trenchii TaxID=1381693 RepID=A0ABP0PY88_9DINO